MPDKVDFIVRKINEKFKVEFSSTCMYYEYVCD